MTRRGSSLRIARPALRPQAPPRGHTRLRHRLRPIGLPFSGHVFASNDAETSRTSSAPAARDHVQIEPDHHTLDDGLGLVPIKALRFAPTTPAAWLAALTGSSTGPDGNYVMVRETLAREPCSPVGANVIADDTMDDIIKPESVPKVISIARCRELLGDQARDLSDEQVNAIRHHAHAMAHLLVEIFMSNTLRA
jgi:hypothetical protein